MKYIAYVWKIYIQISTCYSKKYKKNHSKTSNLLSANNQQVSFIYIFISTHFSSKTECNLEKVDFSLIC